MSMDIPVRSDPHAAPTLSDLRGRHLALLEQWTPDLATELSPRAEALRQQARALGAWLDSPEDRDRAQGIIDYWTAALISVPGLSFPDMVRLEPFTPELAQAAAERAEAILAPQAGTAVEQDAGAMLLCLVRLGPGERLVTRAPVEQADLIGGDLPAEAAARRAELLDAWVRAGILRRISGEGGEEDRFEFAHGSVARAWPRIRNLVEENRSFNSTREGYRATARLWKESRDPGLLVGGSSLSELGRYVGGDRELAEFASASRAAADRRRRQWLAAGTIGPVLAVALLIGSNYLSYDRGIRSEDLAQITRSEAPNIENTLAAEQQVAEANAGGPTTAPTRQQPDLGTPGWIWAGSAGEPLLRDPESGELANPAAIAPGSTWRLRTDIVLRSGLPDANYASAPEVGIAPAGALVYVTDQVRGIPRPSGVQYWLPVRVLPRVYIQYANARPARVEPLRGVLREAGFEAPPIDQEASAARLRQVRYFRKEDADIASVLARRLAAVVRGPGGTPVPISCRRVRSARPDTSHLEIWLDFRGLELGAPRADPDAPVPAPSCT